MNELKVTLANWFNQQELTVLMFGDSVENLHVIDDDGDRINLYNFIHIAEFRKDLDEAIEECKE